MCFSRVNDYISCINGVNKDIYDLFLGRLSLKEEAAGKIRVFAITDVITQSLMGPLSDGIFLLLKRIPTDGTFNQGAPLSRLSEIVRSRKREDREEIYSFDLSAATDRLPIGTQESILRLLTNPSLASS